MSDKIIIPIIGIDDDFSFCYFGYESNSSAVNSIKRL